MDCFMGSVTTGVACINTGHRFIGMELDKGYYDVATGRIQQALASQAKLVTTRLIAETARDLFSSAE
jgi:site-specific DNA-methyltransferase (adenine-specific)